jgi:hypothetical protein
MPSLQFEESGFLVEIQSQAFRFESLPSYSELKGSYIKEMDFCFFPTTRRLILCELTDLTSVLTRQRLEKCELPDCASKARDSVLMLAACWMASAFGQRLIADISTTCSWINTKPDEIMVFFIMKVDDASAAAMVDALSTPLTSLLRGLSKLYNITDVRCLTQYTIQPINQFVKPRM